MSNRESLPSLDRAKLAVGEFDNLEAMLCECLNWGRQRLYCSDNLSWSCNIKLNTTHAFMQGEVSSGFNHNSPSSAVLSVLEKLRKLN